MRAARLTLILDADDTLWENNIYFEDAIDKFLDYAAAWGAEAGRTRERLFQVERGNVARHGYGSIVFEISLRETLEAMLERPASAEERELIRGLVTAVREMPIRFLPGVKETLDQLRDRHRLFLFTKGDLDEQRRKVDRSGVAPWFSHVEVTPEKNIAAYHRLVDNHRLEPRSTWMVGNSPRSDINPALAAGLNTVLIPHPRTWQLEHEDVNAAAPERCKVLESFPDLLNWF
jgi:putative hydrolase of the HAD superfamily